jgi:hypothetical protein
MMETLIGKIKRQFLAQFLPASSLGVSAATLVDESGMIKTQMGAQ